MGPDPGDRRVGSPLAEGRDGGRDDSRGEPGSAAVHGRDPAGGRVGQQDGHAVGGPGQEGDARAAR